MEYGTKIESGAFHDIHFQITEFIVILGVSYTQFDIFWEAPYCIFVTYST